MVITFKKKGGKWIHKDLELDVVVSRKRGDKTYSLQVNNKVITRSIDPEYLKDYAKEMFS